jgi:hypothetical protein
VNVIRYEDLESIVLLISLIWTGPTVITRTGPTL